jgi:hypothetical protein
VTATVRETEPPPDARRKVAALLAVRLGAASTPLTTSTAIAWKSVAAAIALGAAAVLGLGLHRDGGAR